MASITAEASYSERRHQGIWRTTQQQVLTEIERAACNICFTQRDLVGLRRASPLATLEKMPPFITGARKPVPFNHRLPARLVTVAMMRGGDKLNSYARLATALKQLLHIPWTLAIVGDGPKRKQVHALFDGIPDERLTWHGQQDDKAVASVISQSSLYVWPGCGEAYGLAYLEAQSAGLPVVAYDTAGVPEVVDHGYSGILTPSGDDQAYAQAIESLLLDAEQLAHMSSNAHDHVQRKHTLDQASKRLDLIVRRSIGLLE